LTTLERWCDRLPVGHGILRYLYKHPVVTGMTSEDGPVQRCTLNEPVDLRVALDEAAIEYLDVDDDKTIVIYRSAVLIVRATEGHATNATAFAVELWEPPADDFEYEPDDLLATFIDELIPREKRSQ